MFYFEVLIVDSGFDDTYDEAIGIGLCDKNYPVDQMPGWYEESIAYHGDDGHVFYNEEMTSMEVGKTFKAGDHIGILIDYSTGTLRSR